MVDVTKAQEEQAKKILFNPDSWRERFVEERWRLDDDILKQTPELKPALKKVGSTLGLYIDVGEWVVDDSSFNKNIVPQFPKVAKGS